MPKDWVGDLTSTVPAFVPIIRYRSPGAKIPQSPGFVGSVRIGVRSGTFQTLSSSFAVVRSSSFPDKSLWVGGMTRTLLEERDAQRTSDRCPGCSIARRTAAIRWIRYYWLDKKQ